MKNLGINTIDSFEMAYQVNSGNMESEMVYEILNSGDLLEKTFTTTANFSNPGTYLLNGFVTIPEDVDLSNNEITGTYQVTQLPNYPISLPYQQNFEGISVSTFSENVIGLNGIEEWDFTPDSNGKLNFVNEGSNKCLESKDFSTSGTNEGLTVTLNMSNYLTIEDLELSFDYKYSLPNAQGEGDYIYVRGSDTDTWIQTLELTPDSDWANSGKINISNFLIDNSQQLSSSFQIHFSQGRNSGYALDNFLVNPLVPLPIELTYFTAEKQGRDAFLKWETSSEFNNHRFEIQVASSTTTINRLKILSE